MNAAGKAKQAGRVKQANRAKQANRRTGGIQGGREAFRAQGRHLAVDPGTMRWKRVFL